MELENLYFIYSHYCKYCKKLLPKISTSLPHIKSICIDNKKFRDKILKNNTFTINYVPSIIIIKEQKVTIYQGEDATNYLNDKIKSIHHQNNEYTKLSNEYKKIQNVLNSEQNKIINLENTIEHYKQQLNNQPRTLTSTTIEPQSIPQSPNSMRTSINDLMDSDSDDEVETRYQQIQQKPESLSEMAQRLQDARKQ